jgi:eukaryotic-like serine/threonine-protein kinase
MNAEPFRLDELIESVADGRPVDWDARAAGADARHQRVLNHLRLVANVAAVHRTAGVLEKLPSDSLTEPCAPDPETASWGHLVLVERVAEGAFGEVFRARDPWLDHEVALKLLKPDAHASEGRLRIVNEARALARVRHPNVVCVHGADMHDGRVGLWMELVRGRTLAQIVAAEGPFGAREAAGIGQDICRALAAVHAEHLVHRDVKAQNVMRAAGGRIVLMDFSGGHTPLYLASEVLEGGEATVAADLYALGVLLYFLVTTQFPVQASTVDGLREAHARGERRRLADERPDLPGDFVRAVERALDPEPQRRYASAGGMLEALSNLGTASAPDEPVPRPQKPWWGKRRRWTLVVAALVLAIIAVVVYRLVPSLAPAPPSSPASARNGVPMIAIMPLEGGAGDTSYFADGMSEALMQALSALRTVRVVSRTSVDRVRLMARTLPEIARVLNADAILEGSTQRDADLVRVNLRLIHAGSDTPVWSRSFSESLGNIFALQQRIAEAVAAEWAASSPPTSRIAEQLLKRDWVAANSPGGHQAINPAAYDAYLRGRHEYRRQNEAALRAALEHFQEASRIEPAFARAQLGMAQSYLLLGGEYGVLPQSESARSARDLVDRALRLDGELAEAHATLGTLQFEFDWDFAGAEASFAKAIELDPSLATARESYSMFLTSRGRVDEALEQLAAARLVDPLSALVANLTAQAYYFGRQFDRALTEAQAALQLDPAATGAHVGVARTLHAMGRHQEAITQYERAVKETSWDHPFFQSEIAQAELALGQRDRALARLRALELQVGNPGSRVRPYMLAHVYALFDRDAAFRWFDQEFERRSVHVLWFGVDPRVDPLRSDPRFSTLRTRLGLTP